jgi:hypothetical protein
MITQHKEKLQKIRSPIANNLIFKDKIEKKTKEEKED